MTSRRPTSERLTIGGPSGSLEAVAEDPGLPGTSYGVVCHPHPLFGGTMENKVVTTVARALHQCDIPTLRFNFRGVGASGGVFDHGDGETADAEAVAASGALRWPGRQLVIAGFSFGAYVALRLAQLRHAAYVVTIAPPVERFDFAHISAPACPWLVVQGDADEVVAPQAVVNWVTGLRPAPRLVIMPGAGHFFHGRLLELRDAVIDAIRGERTPAPD
jgi:alpha/beta superfamily hydrolase